MKEEHSKYYSWFNMDPDERKVILEVSNMKSLEQIAKELHTLNKNIETLCKYVKKTK